MPKSLIYILLFSGILTLGCSSGKELSGFTFGKGSYKFKMTDSSGVKYLSGTLNVKKYENEEISGTYEFTDISNDKFDGLSTMTGEFEGTVNKTEKTVFINTNPKIADANVFWNLRINKNNLSGSWQYSAFRGKMNGGIVKITK